MICDSVRSAMRHPRDSNCSNAPLIGVIKAARLVRYFTGGFNPSMIAPVKLVVEVPVFNL